MKKPIGRNPQGTTKPVGDKCFHIKDTDGTQVRIRAGKKPAKKSEAALRDILSAARRHLEKLPYNV